MRVVFPLQRTAVLREPGIQGARIATGDYMLFLDGDDILVPWALAVYKRVLERRHAVLILGREGVLPRIAACSDVWRARA